MTLQRPQSAGHDSTMVMDTMSSTVASTGTDHCVADAQQAHVCNPSGIFAATTQFATMCR